MFESEVLIMTTYESSTNNNISESEWYKNNLKLPPFGFPEDKLCIYTHPSTEIDLTCVCDLSEKWVDDFVHSKCI